MIPCSLTLSVETALSIVFLIRNVYGIPVPRNPTRCEYGPHMPPECFTYDDDVPVDCLEDGAPGCHNYTNAKGEYIITDRKQRFAVSFLERGQMMYYNEYAYIVDDPPTLDDFGMPECSIAPPTVDLCANDGGSSSEGSSGNDSSDNSTGDGSSDNSSDNDFGDNSSGNGSSDSSGGNEDSSDSSGGNETSSEGNDESELSLEKDGDLPKALSDCALTVVCLVTCLLLSPLL